jgi:hypothetical protein
MVSDHRDYTLRPAEATDSDELRNKDGDTVVDPPDHWQPTEEHEALDDKLAAEEPDANSEPSADVERDPQRHRGQIDGTPEDGDSFFPVVEE